MRSEDRKPAEPPPASPMPCPDARLVQHLRQGDPEAGRQFVREHYAGIYRYLLYLTGRREAAEDLTQETFLQAWRRLETFDPRGPLRPWLHRIAHREFLQALRSQRSEASLDELPEALAPHAGDLTEGVELRAVMARLPRGEREVLVLHYLEGYSYQEIARIVGAPLTTVKYRLTAARGHLQRELGVGDLVYLNQAPEAVLRRWAWLPLEALTALEARLSVMDRGKKGERTMSEGNPAGMSRRRLLGAAGSAAAAAAAGLASPLEASTTRNEAEIIDERLTRTVTLAVKATALADLCEQLHRDTGIALAAGPSVADEKVTLFCEKLPLREVMRQLSRPFGYTWLRSGKPGAYRYELVQELRSQLLEEELRNRDRNTALLALEQEIEAYRRYLDLSPDEARARAKLAAPEAKERLDQLAGVGWGVIQMYFRLSAQDLALLRAGQELRFSEVGGERPLPLDLARGALQAQRDLRFFRSGSGFEQGDAKSIPEGRPLTAIPEARASVIMKLGQGELGQFTLSGGCGFAIQVDGKVPNSGSNTVGPIAVGISPAVSSPYNALIHARAAHHPALQSRITVHPRSSCEAHGSATTADALEALHQATGLPVVADYYTHLFSAAAVALDNQPLFDALNQLADGMRLRWNRDEEWLQFRSVSFYDDRLKEVPNRLLARWAAARQAHGELTLDGLCEISRLSDPQLDADDMAAGARKCWRLAEWGLAQQMRQHLRFLADLSPAQRQEACSARGLPFPGLTLAQQQQYITLGLGDLAGRIQSLEELTDATLRVEYTQPGWYQWGVKADPDRPGRPLIGPWPVQEPTQAAALQAARKLDPQVDESQLVRTHLNLQVIYLWGRPDQRSARIIYPGGGRCYTPW